MKWLVLAAAFLLVISPIDLWPDWLPGGTLDDVAYAIGAAQQFRAMWQKEKLKRKSMVIDAVVKDAPGRA